MTKHVLFVLPFSRCRWIEDYGLDPPMPGADGGGLVKRLDGELKAWAGLIGRLRSEVDLSQCC
jgi:hypothetical protein